jgi:excisionase family DNA binding protein
VTNNSKGDVIMKFDVTKGEQIQMMPETLLTGIEVANILKVSRSYAYTLLQRGEIPKVRIGRAVRVRPSDLDAYIKRCIQNGDQLDGIVSYP